MSRATGFAYRLCSSHACQYAKTLQGQNGNKRHAGRGGRHGAAAAAARFMAAARLRRSHAAAGSHRVWGVAAFRMAGRLGQPAAGRGFGGQCYRLACGVDAGPCTACCTGRAGCARAGRDQRHAATCRAWPAPAVRGGAGLAARADRTAAAPCLADLVWRTTPQGLQAGQRWQWTVRLKAPHGDRNPHGMDWELWLWSQGIQATGYVRTGKGMEVPQWRGQTWQARWRSGVAMCTVPCRPRRG